MTSVAEGAAAPSEFQHRGALFRNVVITCSLLTGSLQVASTLIWSFVPKGDMRGGLPWDTVPYCLVPLGLLAIVQVLPRGAWRWVGLVGLVFAGLGAFFSLLALVRFGYSLRVLFAIGTPPFLLFLQFANFLTLSSFLTGTLSWLYLGRYCRGWAREFAAAKAARSEGVGNQESAQKEAG